MHVTIYKGAITFMNGEVFMAEGSHLQRIPLNDDGPKCAICSTTTSLTIYSCPRGTIRFCEQCHEWFHTEAWKALAP